MYFLLFVTYIVCFFLGYLLSRICQRGSSPSPGICSPVPSPGPGPGPAAYIKKIAHPHPIFVQFVSSQGWSMDIIIGNDKLTEFYKLVSKNFIGSWYKQLKQLDSFSHPSGLYVIRLRVERTNEMIPIATDEQLADFFKQCQIRLVQERFRRLGSGDGISSTSVSTPATKEHDE